MSESIVDNDGWSKTITPYRGWWDLRLVQLWSYRDLIFVFVHRNFTATYKQTILGPLWFFIQPLFTTIVFTLIFNKIANLSTNEIPPTLFYMSGVVMWNYFQDCLVKTSSTFTQNAGLFGKVYFPRLTIPISIVITNLMTFALQFVFFLCFMAYFWIKGAPIHPGWQILTLPFLLLEMACLGLGVGCIVSALTTRYRDLTMLVGFGVQLWMYGSCVVYSLSDIDGKWRQLLVWNPMVSIIEGFRYAFLGQGIVERSYLFIGFGVSVAILLIGVTLFNHVEKTFSDTV